MNTNIYDAAVGRLLALKPNVVADLEVIATFGTPAALLTGVECNSSPEE